VSAPSAHLIAESYIPQNLSDYDNVSHENGRACTKDHSIGLIPPGDAVTSHNVREIEK